MFVQWANFLRDRRGATSIEYALIAGLMSLLIVGGVTSIGSRLQTKFYGPVTEGFS